MNNYHLVTTSIEETWPEKGENIYFLGEWCKIYGNENINKYKTQTQEYHWNDRLKLLNDFNLLNRIYEKKLVKITEELNNYHKLDKSLRYWRILIGPWLQTFIQIIYDRYYTIKLSSGINKIKKTKIIHRENEQIIPLDMDDFNGMHIDDDWNEWIYGLLIEKFTNIEITKVKGNYSKKGEKRKNYKEELKNIVSGSLQLISDDRDIFVIKDYLPKNERVKLQLMLRQIPKIWGKKKLSIVYNNKRDFNFDCGEANEFEKMLDDLIAMQIPRSYVEGYNNYIEDTEKSNWPGKPIKIFTSNSHYSDDYFKCWAAEKVEKNSKLIIGQHGGGYGLSEINSIEDHEVKISDAWLSWGWSDANRKNIIPVGNLKMINQKRSYQQEGGCLISISTCSRYSGLIYSGIISSQMEKYFNDQYVFINNLPDVIKNKTTVRLYESDHKNNQKQRFHDQFQKINIDDGKKNIWKLIKKSRVHICTYNSTGFLESLHCNIPTILFYDPKYGEIRDDGIEYIQMLLRCGILHFCPISAANKLAEVWDAIPDWWSSNDVELAKKLFCSRYSKRLKVDELARVIKNH